MPENQKMFTIDKYNFYGNIFHIESTNKKLLKTMRRFLCPFYSKISTLRPKVIFTIIDQKGISPLKESQYFYNKNLILLLNSQRYVTCNLYDTPWQVYIQYFKEGFKHLNKKETNYVYFYFFEPVLLNILKRLNLFHLHSAAVAKDDYGIIIPGGPESGKTTTTLSLLRAGFKILSDDQIFLQKSGLNIYALGFNEGIFITDKTISFFPELNFLKKTPLYKRGSQFKRYIEIPKIYPHLISKKTKVHLVIFPKIFANQKTRIEPISKPQAIIKMLSQKPKEYPRYFADNIALTKQFELYFSLTQSARAYNLFIGKEIDRIPRLILGLF